MTVRVLLADDQALLRGAFRMLLDSADDITVVGEAGDGREAVRLTRDLRPDDMRNAVTLAAKSLKVSPTELDAVQKAFDGHGIVKGWEYKGGTHDGTTLARDVLPAYEVYSGVDEQAAQINGDVYAISHGDAIAWDRGSAAFGITVGRFGKQDGGPGREVAEDDAYLLDPSLDDDRMVFTRVSADGIGVYRTGAKGQGAVRKVVDEPDASSSRRAWPWRSSP